MELLVVVLLAVPAVLASPPRVTCTHTKPVILGADVTLTCEFKAQLDVLQVTWQKKMGKDSQNMVTYSEKYGINIAKPFKELLTVLDASSTIFSIKISKLEKEDATCYNCLFNAYPNGAFTGEVCLTDIELANEVLCTARGNDLKILLNPSEIRTRQSVQLIEEKIGVFAKGQYSDITINPTCEFQLEREMRKKRNAHENQIHSAEDADKKFVVTQCRASGTNTFRITWYNEGEPVRRDDNTSMTRDVITVTSTLTYTASSLPANLSCSITHDLPPGADPEKAARCMKESVEEINEEQQQNFWIRFTIIISVTALFLITVSILCYKALKRTEAKTPKKSSKAENGLLTPMNYAKRMYQVTTGALSPKFAMENDSGKVISPLVTNGGTPINDGTPFNSARKNPRESMESSVKKRPKSERAKKLDMNDKHNEH